ncbi:MAG: hypothetical protein JWN11_1266 [Hyphomicrobiales bacterium]|jgi:hypothetical protein|nr:hypothetical protein [Hyphomicrobiales bacterium]
MRLKIVAAAALAVVALFGATAAASAMDRHVNVTNGTKVKITEFYASSAGTKTWEEDILGKGVIEPGQAWNINVDDGTGYCKYDFKAVFADGDEAEKDGVNVCELSKFTFTE